MAAPDTGSPDWQRVVQSRSGNLFPAGSQTLPPGSTYTGYEAMQSWPGVLLQVSPSAGYGTVTVYWYASASAADFIASHSWDVNTSTGLTVMLPAEGQYMVVGIDVKSTVDMTAVTYLFGVSNGPPRIYYPVTGADVAEYEITLAAGAAATYKVPWIVKGRAHFYWDPDVDGANMSTAVQVTDAAGTVTGQLAKFSAVTSPSSVDVVMPEQPVEVVVTNFGTTGTGTYKVSLIPENG